MADQSFCCDRRAVLSAAGVVAAGAALTGCSNAQRASDAASYNRRVQHTPTGPIASTADIPVGGGVIVGSAEVVVTQPSEGEFKAFSSICPHQGCPVSQIDDGVIICTCHNSHFDIATGDVVSGPARKGLAPRTVTVDGEDVSLG